MTKKNRFFIIAILCLIMLALQIPFLQSDPDIEISGGRGPNTDEGLNTYQIRNFINHGDLTLNSSTIFARNPLFESLLFIPFKIFRSRLLTGRLTVMLISLVILLFIFSNDSFYLKYAGYFFVIVFGEYYIFHHFHYCLSEILSTAFIFLSVFLFAKSVEKDKSLNSKVTSDFLPATFISVAYFLKIQFLYAVTILPVTILFLMLFRLYDKTCLFRKLKYVTCWLLFYFIAYLLIFFLPHKDIFEIVKSETSDRFAPNSYFAR